MLGRLLKHNVCGISNAMREFHMFQVLEFREAVRACTMRLICRFKVHSTSLLFFGIFCLYPLLFRSLQYIYTDMYYSYPSVCPLKRSGTTGNLIFYLISLM